MNGRPRAGNSLAASARQAIAGLLPDYCMGHCGAIAVTLR